jgi:outer membrane protein TolC
MAQLKLTEIRTSAGSVTELDLLRSKAEVARNRQVVADTESLVATSRRTLRTLSGLEPPDALPLPVDIVTPEAALAELEGRVEQLPAVQSADKDITAAGHLVTASKLVLVPTVSAQFTERLTNATSFTGKVGSYNAGLNLVWRLDVPTFMGMQAQAANESAAVLAGERARLQAKDQINSDWQRLTAALIKIDAASAQVDAAQRATQVARDRYAVGAATQVDVIQAERDVFSAEVSQIQARTELATARASLRISAALPLE